MELPCSTCRPESDTRRSSEEDVLYFYRERIFCIHYSVHVLHYCEYIIYIIIHVQSCVEVIFFEDFNFYRMHGV